MRCLQPQISTPMEGSWVATRAHWPIGAPAHWDSFLMAVSQFRIEVSSYQSGPSGACTERVQHWVHNVTLEISTEEHEETVDNCGAFHTCRDMMRYVEMLCCTFGDLMPVSLKEWPQAASLPRQQCSVQPMLFECIRIIRRYQASPVEYRESLRISL